MNEKTTTNEASKAMGAAVNQMSIWEQKHDDIAELFVLNEELLATVDAAEHPQAQFEMIEPLADALGDSADVLSQEYIGLCSGNPATKRTAKARIEGALRKVYVALGAVEPRLAEKKNAALMVVRKIKRQLEEVVSHFMEFVLLSLDRVMQKHDMEALTVRHASIALMLHQMGRNGA